MSTGSGGSECDGVPTGDTSITILDGLVFPVDPTDPADCFGKVHADYVGSELLMVEIGGQMYPLHMCGDTNTGMNWNGCSHGELNGGGAFDACEYDRTGETVVAQACVLDGCTGYILDPTSSPYVLMAEINGQWFIVNVITGAGLPDTDDLSQLPCEDACCGVGVNFLEATIGGSCGALNGLVFELESSAGGGTWTGQVTAGGETFVFNLACPVTTSESTSWTASGGCGAAQPPTDLVVECNPANTGTGTGSSIGNGLLSGSATFPSTVCSACSGDLVVSFVAIDKTPKSACNDVVYTGEYVKAQACGLNQVEVGASVILAEVPPESGIGESQWQIVQLCQNEGECPPCPPPPPPENLDCCDFDETTVPQTLSGIVTLSGIPACECTGNVTFEYVPGSNPPEWNQVGVLDCEDQTGTAVSISDIAGLVVKCSGTTGTADASGTGVTFFLTPPGCVAGSDVESDSGQCDPMLASWSNVVIDGCCGPLGIPHTGLTLYLALEISE